jgi:hypothetical protein
MFDYSYPTESYQPFDSRVPRPHAFRTLLVVFRWRSESPEISVLLLVVLVDSTSGRYYFYATKKYYTTPKTP